MLMGHKWRFCPASGQHLLQEIVSPLTLFLVGEEIRGLLFYYPQHPQKMYCGSPKNTGRLLIYIIFLK